MAAMTSSNVFTIPCKSLMSFLKSKQSPNSCYRSCSHGQGLLYLQLCADEAKGSIQRKMTLCLCVKTAGFSDESYCTFHLPGIGSRKCSLNHLNRPFNVACTRPRYRNPSGVTLTYSTRALTRGRYPRKNFPGNSLVVLNRYGILWGAFRFSARRVSSSFVLFPSTAR